MRSKILRWSYAFLARILNWIIPVKKKHWIFGSDLGRTYREGSKYLIEFVLKNHPEIVCTFITQSREVYEELKMKGIPCKMNNSISGIINICQADCEFFSQSVNDILYAYKKRERHHFYLIHGQPYKKAVKALPKDYFDRVYGRKNTLFERIRLAVGYWAFSGRTIFDSEFISATSDFLIPYLHYDNGDDMVVKVLGMPRNDALFQGERMKKEKWISGIEGKFVVLYMPTHRAYGAGTPSPTPFVKRQDIQSWMRQNNVVLLMKNHPNMIPHIKDEDSTDVIIDITKKGIDPQVCIYYSSVLITDYSSVWMDYLILQRPIIFYTYDDWEENDAGVYYDLKEDPPGIFCKTEDELFNLIKRAKMDYDSMTPSLQIVSKYHKYVDGNSCQRYFNTIEEELYEKG